MLLIELLRILTQANPRASRSPALTKPTENLLALITIQLGLAATVRSGSDREQDA